MFLIFLVYIFQINKQFLDINIVDDPFLPIYNLYTGNSTKNVNFKVCNFNIMNENNVPTYTIFTNKYELQMNMNSLYTATNNTNNNE